MKRHLASFAAATLALAACSGAPYAALPIDDDASAKSNVLVAEESLYDVVRVGSPYVERVPGSNQLRVRVAVRNIDIESIQVAAQVSFLGLNREPLGDETSRDVLVIGPGVTMTSTALSKRADAADWQMTLNWNH
jgi:hypothetical protein